MKSIKKLVDITDDELDGAEMYAEKYIEAKAEGDSNWASRYNSMAQDEMNHANYIHELAVQKVDKLRKIYSPPAAMLEKWNESHREFINRSDSIKGMLV